MSCAAGSGTYYLPTRFSHTKLDNAYGDEEILNGKVVSYRFMQGSSFSNIGV